MLGLTSAGVAINDDAALSISTVMSSIALITDGVSTLPLGARKWKDDQKADTPVLLRNPWPECTLQDWLVQVMVSLLLRGNAYLQIVDRDSNGYAATLMPIHPDDVFARRDRDTGKRIYKVRGKPVDVDDMVHIPAILVPGSFIGLNPVEYARAGWGLAAASERYGGQFFANSANPSGVIEVPGDLSPEETRELGNQWKQLHQGVANANLPAVLTGGATWTQMSLSPDDAQFLQTRQYQREEIIAWFRIPPHKMGLQDRTPSSTTGIEQLEMGYVTDTLMPWIARLESYLTRLIRPGVYAHFDVSHRLRGDTLQRFQAYQIARNGGWLNVDEIRLDEGMPPIADGKGQDYLQPLNMGLLGEPPAAKPGPPNSAGPNNTDGHGGKVGKGG